MHIAICGQLGSGCTEVAQSLSKKLGLKFVSSSEIVKALVAEYRESFRDFEEKVRSGEVDLDMMMDSQLDEIMEEGDVMVEGRSAFMLLNEKNAFKVLLVASEEERAKHIANIRGITVEEAMKDIEYSDKERKNLVERLFDKDWLDPHNYDLVVNTRSRSFDDVATLLFKTIKSLYGKQVEVH
jgi:predicted cytidylate kinase